jgi:hypothetical protein
VGIIGCTDQLRFFISAVLQLFIAVSTIIFVLEEARVINLEALQLIEQQNTE